MAHYCKRSPVAQWILGSAVNSGFKSRIAWPPYLSFFSFLCLHSNLTSDYHNKSKCHISNITDTYACIVLCGLCDDTEDCCLPLKDLEQNTSRSSAPACLRASISVWVCKSQGEPSHSTKKQNWWISPWSIFPVVLRINRNTSSFDFYFSTFFKKMYVYCLKRNFQYLMGRHMKSFPSRFHRRGNLNAFINSETYSISEVLKNTITSFTFEASS